MNNIINKRNFLKMSQTKLRESVNLSSVTICNAENGDATSKTLFIINQFLNGKIKEYYLSKKYQSFTVFKDNNDLRFISNLKYFEFNLVDGMLITSLKAIPVDLSVLDKEIKIIKSDNL
jgi:DNA-binding XRE family transcriptional regulator